jgi:hypothetical protein
VAEVATNARPRPKGDMGGLKRDYSKKGHAAFATMSATSTVFDL